jgi:hypothetical protein
MSGILAIEPDPTRKRLLRALVRHVNANITIADSVGGRDPKSIGISGCDTPSRALAPSNADEIMGACALHA